MDRGPCGQVVARRGSGEKPEGKRLALEIGHRADTDQGVKGLPLQVGGKERGPDIVFYESGLRVRAATNGRSMEEEAPQILRAALGDADLPFNLVAANQVARRSRSQGRSRHAGARANASPAGV